MRLTWLLALVALLLSACAARPEKPNPGEMTGVIVSTNDACCWPSGGVVPDGGQFDVVALVPPADFIAWFNDQHADDDHEPMTEPDDWRAGSWGVRVPLARFTTYADPGDAPLVAPLTRGRWRVPYDGDAVMACVGSRGYEYEWVYTDGYRYQQRVDDTEYLRLRCGLVDRPSPARVTVSVHFGGIGVSSG